MRRLGSPSMVNRMSSLMTPHPVVENRVDIAVATRMSILLYIMSPAVVILGSGRSNSPRARPK